MHRENRLVRSVVESIDHFEEDGGLLHSFFRVNLCSVDCIVLFLCFSIARQVHNPGIAGGFFCAVNSD